MIAIIVIFLLALIGAVFTIYALNRTPFREDHHPVLPERRFDGLFAGSEAPPLAGGPHNSIASIRQTLLDLAKRGDLNSLAEAQSTHDSALYYDVLGALVTWTANRQEDLAALVSHISKSNELRANKELAQRLIETWKTAPDRRSTTEMIHIGALADDAETYERSIDAVLDLWRRGQLPQFSADELAELFVSQYWVIAPEARRGGVGFALKRRLSAVRRELAAITSAR